MAHGDYETLTPQAIDQVWLRLRAGHAAKPTARELGLCTGTVRAYLLRCSGTKRYRAARADQSAWGRAARPKTCRLMENPLLRAIVEEKLARRWSPQQIAGWLKVSYPTTRRCRCRTRASTAPCTSSHVARCAGN